MPPVTYARRMPFRDRRLHLLNAGCPQDGPANLSGVPVNFSGLPPRLGLLRLAGLPQLLAAHIGVQVTNVSEVH